MDVRGTPIRVRTHLPRLECLTLLAIGVTGCGAHGRPADPVATLEGVLPAVALSERI